jgi:hypothetical protein
MLYFLGLIQTIISIYLHTFLDVDREPMLIDDNVNASFPRLDFTLKYDDVLLSVHLCVSYCLYCSRIRVQVTDHCHVLTGCPHPHITPPRT